jgi:gas vesicle protein GvpA/GvpJ/GvpM family
MSSRDLAQRSGGGGMAGGSGPAQLADVLERVLDKGIVIAGDIKINLLDIELLTVKLRLLIASADKAREMGIDWWEGDPFLSRRAGGDELESRLRRLEQAAGVERNGDES